MRHFKRLATMLALTGLSACASDNLSSIQRTPPNANLTIVQPAFRSAAAKPPSGYIAFCIRFADQCSAPNDAPREIALTEQVWSTLQQVNAALNKAILPEDDSVHYGTREYWTIPTDGYGDCEDYVVAKRQALIRLGLPKAALRITVVFAPHFVRHAVLTVATDKGNYVLDNLRGDIVPWEKTGYTFVERQDPASATGWVSLE
jgi:predicted transglutaminase-like cysteine proteinase